MKKKKQACSPFFIIMREQILRCLQTALVFFGFFAGSCTCSSVVRLDSAPYRWPASSPCNSYVSSQPADVPPPFLQLDSRVGVPSWPTPPAAAHPYHAMQPRSSVPVQPGASIGLGLRGVAAAPPGRAAGGAQQRHGSAPAVPVAQRGHQPGVRGGYPLLNQDPTNSLASATYLMPAHRPLGLRPTGVPGVVPRRPLLAGAGSSPSGRPGAAAGGDANTCLFCFEHLDHGHGPDHDPAAGVDNTFEFQCPTCGARTHASCWMPWVVPLLHHADANLPESTTPGSVTIPGMSLGDGGQSFFNGRLCPRCGIPVPFFGTNAAGGALAGDERAKQRLEELLLGVLDTGVDLMTNTEKAALSEGTRLASSYLAWRSVADWFLALVREDDAASREKTNDGEMRTSATWDEETRGKKPFGMRSALELGMGQDAWSRWRSKCAALRGQAPMFLQGERGTASGDECGLVLLLRHYLLNPELAAAASAAGGRSLALGSRESRTVSIWSARSPQLLKSLKGEMRFLLSFRDVLRDLYGLEDLLWAADPDTRSTVRSSAEAFALSTSAASPPRGSAQDREQAALVSLEHEFRARFARAILQHDAQFQTLRRSDTINSDNHDASNSTNRNNRRARPKPAEIPREETQLGAILLAVGVEAPQLATTVSIWARNKDLSLDELLHEASAAQCNSIPSPRKKSVKKKKKKSCSACWLKLLFCEY